MVRSLLVDLSPLERRTISLGVRRYAAQLCAALGEEQERLKVMVLLRSAWLRRGSLSLDFAGSLKALEDRRHRGLFPQTSHATARQLRRAAHSAEADLVHCLTPEASPRGALRLPRIVTCHHINSDLSPAEWHGASIRWLSKDVHPPLSRRLP